jgi:phosphoglycolate phosphatase/AHBA synthesis associated protein
MTDAVLFDLDGVLVDSREVWFHLVNDAARSFGHAPLDRDGFARIWGQGVHADARMWNRSVEEVEAFFDAHFMDHGAHLRVDPEARPVLDSLNHAGVRSALITNTPGPLAREILDRVGLELNVVVGGTDVSAPKPAPEMVERALQRLEVSAPRAWVVGDSRYDRDAARAAGVRFAGLGLEGDVQLMRLGELLGLLGLAAA